MIKRPSVDELTGLRGIAALLVLLNHLILLYPSVFGAPGVRPVFDCLGVMGMDLFFILSGFVIYYNYADNLREAPREGIIKFLIARFARLYPLYIVFITGFFIYNIITLYNLPEYIRACTATLPAFLIGVQTWIYTFVGDTPMLHLQNSSNITWSISTEFGLYLVFIPLILFLFKKKDLRTAILFFLIALAGCFLWPTLVYQDTVLTDVFNHFTPENTYYSPRYYLTYHCPLGTRAYEFLAGCSIAQIYLCIHGRFNKNIFRIARICVLAALVAVVFTCEEANHNIMMVISILLVFYIFSATLGSASLLKSKPLMVMGDLSYSTYLLHIIFILIFAKKGHSISSTVLNTVLTFACTYAAAYVSYKFLEVPARRWTRNFLTGLFNFKSNGATSEQKNC